MCGIAGLVDFSGAGGTPRDLERIALRMASTLVHRGPDDSGVWVDPVARVAFGHRRLSIIDLSVQGHQPMVSGCGRYVINFNGEIYNFAELKKNVEKAEAVADDGQAASLDYRWRGRSDTEVMLAAIRKWGLHEAVKKFNGMFAFAVWDRQEQVLSLVRDRIGEKPLYYGWMGGAFLFGSELKALRAHPAWRGDISRSALTLFLRFSCVPCPYSIYENVFKLPPGAIVQIRVGELRAAQNRAVHFDLKPEYYWSARESVTEGVKHAFEGSEQEAIGELDRHLCAAVKQQMIADVPLGAFLSGGIDSSAIVALMQAQSSKPVRTFTIGFEEAGYNEAEDARRVARHLHTEHTEFYVSAVDALAVIPKLPEIFDEPFSDPSQVPTHLVAQLAKRHVTVTLSGDGGDELFGGYNRYFWGSNFWNKLKWLPRDVRASLSEAVLRVPSKYWESVFSAIGAILPHGFREPVASDKLYKLAEVLDASTPERMYLGLASHWKKPETVVIGGSEPPTLLTDADRWPTLGNFAQRMMYFDLVTYLPDDILTKLDRAAMSVSLESRLPYLDHRVVEFAWRLPLSMKIRGREGKWILRQLLYKYVPKSLVERPKMGFGVPIDSWLREPLREWAETLLEESRLKREGYFKPAPIRQKWREHLSGQRSWQYHLWDVLMFQSWLEHQNRNG